LRESAIFAFGLALRCTLIWRFPVIFGGDTMVRMMRRDRILISHQLPLLQSIVVAIAHVTHEYVATMVAMATVGALVGPAMYRLARQFMGERAAWSAGLLIAANPLIAGNSIVPFQESLMLAMLLYAFAFYYEEKYGRASVFLGLACLTRFEAWAAAPVMAVAYGWRRGTAGVLRGAALFGWVPVAWIVFRRGLSPEGSFVLDAHVSAARLMRWVYLAYITAKFTPVIVLGLGIAGLWFLKRRMWPMIVFLALFTIALLFSAHGDPPDPERRISAREAHLWIAAVSFLAALVLDRIEARLAVVLASTGIALGVWGSYRYVAREASDPRLQLSYRTAKVLDSVLRPGERAVIQSRPWPPATFDFFLRRARETGGEGGYRAALKNLEESDLSPPDYQRTLIHSKFDRDRILAAAPGCVEWVASWSDFAPATGEVSVVLQDAGLEVRIGRRDCK
jgi:hypothetical protein